MKDTICGNESFRMRGRALCQALAVVVAVAAAAGAAKTINIDADWEYALKDGFNVSFRKVGMGPAGNNNGIPRVAEDTNGWKRVDLPHDWARELPFADKPGGTRNGFKAIGEAYRENSVAWYRKWFAMPAGGERGRVYLQFDGVYRDAQFWLNGVYLGRNDSGYIGRRFDVTDLLRDGDAKNFLAVRVDATKDEGWWYDGAGIYRHVWLILKNERHILPDGIYCRTLSADKGRAVLSLKAEVSAPGEGEMAWTLRRGGSAVARARGFEAEMQVPSPALWSPSDPNLYTLVAEYSVGGNVVDSEETTVGVRIVEFTPDRGLLVNGERVQVNGVCCHQDHAGVGVALPDAIQDYRVRRLKSMGVNAYRTSHNPPTPELLDACDRHGVVVMDEARFFSSSDEGLSQFSRLLVRDRNHPCVVAWSLGNEEHNVQDTPTGRRIAERMKALQRRLDPGRVVTYGGNNGVRHAGANEAVDVRGINYIRLARVDKGDFDKYHAEHPSLPIWGSEEASTLCMRGGEVCKTNRLEMADADTVANRPYSWAYTAEEWTTRAAERPWFAGAFAWTGFDYRGECPWPASNCNFGILDLCGYEKNNAHYYAARWTDRDVLHIYPHPNMARTNFWVNTNCDSVELFVNGRSVGRQTRPEGVYRLNFQVAFEKGTVEARGVRAGREVTASRATSGPLARIKATVDRAMIAADGADATVVDLVALDAAGREVPDCCLPVRFRATGAGSILGVGNGNPLSHEPDVCEAGAWTRRFFYGRCQVVVRAGRAPGRLVITAEAYGAPPADVSIEVK